jgi:hypothetical protein
MQSVKWDLLSGIRAIDALLDLRYERLSRRISALKGCNRVSRYDEWWCSKGRPEGSTISSRSNSLGRETGRCLPTELIIRCSPHPATFDKSCIRSNSSSDYELSRRVTYARVEMDAHQSEGRGAVRGVSRALINRANNVWTFRARPGGFALMQSD